MEETKGTFIGENRRLDGFEMSKYAPAILVPRDLKNGRAQIGNEGSLGKNEITVSVLSWNVLC